jgi:hypothetical protein
MEFTEREMTVAVDAVARRLFAATRPPWRRGRTDADWDALAPIERYHRKKAVGETVLPALRALPERPTIGAAPRFSDEEYARAAAAGSRALLEQRSPGAWETMPKRRRRRLARAAVRLTRTAVEALPVREDADEPTVPDHL